MKLSRAEVTRVAELARLRLTTDEEAQMVEQLGQILGYMAKLKELETTDVEPFSHAAENVDALREDRVTNRPDPDALLANAPDRDGTFFKVPKIIE
ncbi:MAG TPA: Asp-tRNA(Asn)/Glu-tRNA(Gln) amidotransferase subunit GatC [Terriglobales bacterium]|jgi:aspartyl-tRNA(Asn)/glutamyl-tRNA(Gln) amidotransferase subunit C|nr:Asp-tRNA(Asn)/Glu-tRNA(Gln) amidotransferase subunit GatC [Terriglobales bacterium]